jgi:glycosyltransferase involved in cell wall biosynthesis
MVCMKISVIIPAFNEERLLGATLAEVQRSLQPFTDLNWDTELIVCDNNSTDRTADIARAAGAKVVFEAVNQIARARNCGAAAATGDWLLFIDADSHPSPELMQDVADAIQSGRYAAGGVTLRMVTRNTFARLLSSAWNGLSRVRRLMAGSFIFVETKAFRAVGGFSLELFAGEELDLSLRLTKHAKSSGRRLVILHRHPLVTSGRKLDLYSQRELVGFMVRALISPRRVMRSREECHPWYDGRR